MTAADRHAGRAASAYLEADILNEGPLARVARLYDMAGVEVARARAGLAASNHAAKGLSINRAVRCISVLQSSLNLGQGGEVARNLDRIYGYVLRRLSEGLRDNDDRALAEVARHLGDLGSAWREVARRQAADAACDQPAAAAAVR
jgi:flagellar protein FliS